MRFFGGLSVEEIAEVLERVAGYGEARLETREGVVGTGASQELGDKG